MVKKSKHLSAREKREVKKIASSVLATKTEKKTYDVDFANLPLQLAYTTDTLTLSDGLQGVDDDSRTGNKITVRNVHFRGAIQPSTKLNNVVRIMLVQWVGLNSDSVIPEPPLKGFDPINTAASINNFCLWKQRKQDDDSSTLESYKILIDEAIWFDNRNTSVQSPFDIMVDGSKLANKGVITYSKETGNVYADPLVMYGWGLDPTVGNLHYQYRVTFD